MLKSSTFFIFFIIHDFWKFVFGFWFLQMVSTNSSDYFYSNSKQLDVTLECHIDESIFHLRANAIFTDHVFDSKSVINKLCFQPSFKSRILILLCHLLSMPLVWSTLMSEVLKLEQDFVHGYIIGSDVFMFHWQTIIWRPKMSVLNSLILEVFIGINLVNNLINFWSMLNIWNASLARCCGFGMKTTTCMLENWLWIMSTLMSPIGIFFCGFDLVEAIFRFCCHSNCYAWF